MPTAAAGEIADKTCDNLSKGFFRVLP